LHGAREPGYTLSKDGRGHVRDEIDFIRVALLDRQFAVKLMVYTPDGHRGHRADWALPASDVHERAAHHERTGLSRPGLRL